MSRIAKGPTRYTRVRVEFVLRSNSPHQGINPLLMRKLANTQGATWAFVEKGLRAIGVERGSLVFCSRELAAITDPNKPAPRARKARK